MHAKKEKKFRYIPDISPPPTTNMHPYTEKKAHKGEVVIDEEKVSYETLLEIKSEPSIDKPKSVPSLDNLLKDTTEEHSHHLFDPNCKICTGKVVPPREGSQTTGVSAV